MWSPCECLYRILVLMSRGHRVNGFAVSLGRLRDTYSVVSAVTVRGSDQIILVPRYEQAHRWVPLDALDVPSVAGKDALLSTLCERPDPHRRVVTGGGESFIVR